EELISPILENIDHRHTVLPIYLRLMNNKTDLLFTTGQFPEAMDGTEKALDLFYSYAFDEDSLDGFAVGAVATLHERRARLRLAAGNIQGGKEDAERSKELHLRVYQKAPQSVTNTQN